MNTLHPKILAHTIKTIASYIQGESCGIPEWNTHTGVHVAPNEFTVNNDSFRVMRAGDRYTVGYDDTVWFCAEFTVPESMNGEKVYLHLDFGGEAIVRLDGQIAGAVSSAANSGWVHRDEILLSAHAQGGRTYKIEAESTVCCGALCDVVLAGGSSITYTLSGASLFTVDREAEGYYFFVSSVFDALEHIPDKVVRTKVYNALDESIHMLDFDFGREAFLRSVPQAAEYLHAQLAAIPNAPQGEVIMAGHSHLDVAWLWTTRELVRKTARTFANNLALMEQYGEFKFTQSQAIVYDYMKRFYPEIYERVKQYVKNGQWEIVGNAWVEADTNIASGESLIRQLLYGRGFFMREFGVSSDTYWLPDCFGFTWALPQIIKRSGMKYFITTKLNNNDTNEFPLSLFRWRSHSGDEIVAYLQKVHYQGEYTPGYVSECFGRNKQNATVPAALGMFGYGDGGGGCTYGMIERGKYIREIPGLPASRQGHTDEFFKLLGSHTQQLPVWDGEMYYENHRGTFTSQAFVKKNNRRGEYLMRNAELTSLLAELLYGAQYPYEKLDKAWKLLLVNQFHDILPGTSIHEVFENTRNEYSTMNSEGGEAISTALSKIFSGVRLDGDGIAVFNPMNFSVTCRVSAEIPFDCAEVTDASGKVLQCTVEKASGKNILSFIAEELPAVGFKAFGVKPASVRQDVVYADTGRLENSLLKVLFDENGLLESVYDKRADREVLAGKGNLLTIFADKPVHESAWNLELDYQMKRWDLIKADSIEVVESSPVRGAVRIVRTFNKSVIEQTISLDYDGDTLNFDTRVDWHETEKLLKAAFPVTVRSTFASYEIAHGSITRPTHWNTSYDLAKFEVCAHKWADLSEGDYGVSILNDCKYGYDIKDNLMRISLMRAPNCPDKTADHGVNTFVYSLYPHRGDWRAAKTVKRAFVLNVPPVAGFMKAQDGDGYEKSFISTDRDNVILDAFKPAEDRDGLIIRFYESETCRGKVEVRLGFDISSVTECNLMEVDECPLECGKSSFSFEIKPHEVKTFRLRLS
ncbi:MAG: alpha-mannosidase [Clostridiales bacterium]|nr:alpha-mannosidase [Clostridiales bacterium]